MATETVPEVADPLQRAFLENFWATPLCVSELHFGEFLSGWSEARRIVENNPMLRDFLMEEQARGTQAEDPDGFFKGWRSYYRPYNVSDGVLTIPVKGSLEKGTMQYGRYATGYEYIHRAAARGMSDPGVNSVMLHVDSPGGTSDGLEDLADQLSAYRGRKPMTAMVDSLCCSAAYWLASSADSISTSRSGYLGSIGVRTMHVDFSKMLNKIGINVTHIFSGAHKVDGNMEEPLPKRVRDDLQAQCDKVRERFVAAVAQNRDMSDSDVRDTEARVFDAEQSMSLGFADRIGEFRNEFMRLAGGGSMTGKTQTGAVAPQAPDAEAPNVETERAQAAASARTDERSRFSDVMSSEHYVGREVLAQKLLKDTDMSAADVIGMLEVSEKKVEAVPASTETRNHFNEQMNKDGGTDVGGIPADADADAALLDDGRRKGTVSILANFRKATGFVPMSERAKGGMTNG